MTIDEQIWEVLAKLPDTPIRVSVICELMGARDETAKHNIRWGLKRLSDKGRFNPTSQWKIWHVNAKGEMARPGEETRFYMITKKVYLDLPEEEI